MTYFNNCFNKYCMGVVFEMSTWSGFSDYEVEQIKLSQGNNRLTLQHSLQNKSPPNVDRSGSVHESSSKTVFGNEHTTQTIALQQSEVDKTKEKHTPTTLVSNSSVCQKASQDLALECPQLSLDQLYQQQQIMEEENKQRKSMLEKTLKERYEQTEKESDILLKVKTDLTQLDELVTQDVAILRSKIEEANKVYTIARKRFEKAEKEYISSKVALHEATEKKELLSEHLYTIIQHNELRKSQKLSELMSALHIEDNKEENCNNSAVFCMKTPTPDAINWPSNKAANRLKPVLPSPVPLGSSMISIVHRMD